MITSQTKSPNLAHALNFDQPLYLKREDEHPLGSHKGRSIPVMIDRHTTAGAHSFVISSSGNAALAAATHIAKKPILDLKIFVGENIDLEKLKSLRAVADEAKNITIEQVANPKQSAFQTEKISGVINLRQSTDDSALIGYEELARELSEISNLGAVFVPTSSGTTAVALHRAFLKLGTNPGIHIVQTSACHPMVDKKFTANITHSLAGAIVDKVAHRAPEVAEAQKNSRGGGWIATDDEIRDAINDLKKYEGIEASPNSALSLVGFKQALFAGRKFDGAVVLILTGR